MIIGNSEFDLKTGISMMASANILHAIRKTSGQDREIFLFHFP